MSGSECSLQALASCATFRLFLEENLDSETGLNDEQSERLPVSAALISLFEDMGHLGQARHQKETKQFEIGFDRTDTGFMINSSSSFMKETSFEDLLHEEITDYNNSHHTTSQGPTTSVTSNQIGSYWLKP